MDVCVELNADQRRETVNTQQRYQAWRDASARLKTCRGSMVWSDSRGHEYLLRSSYDEAGKRHQKSLGPRTAATERAKTDFERARDEAEQRVDTLRVVMIRQAAVNRALGLRRVPSLSAKIIRALDARGVLGHGLRVLGSHALYAYEAAAGIHIDSGLTTTEDIDLLLNSRTKLDVIAADDAGDVSLLRILQRVDKSFQRTPQTFRAANKDGYFVDLIKPMRSPPWSKDASSRTQDPDDLTHVEINGLSWHEGAPAFEATAIDERGEPLRIVTSDPRVFAAHKLWLSGQDDRDPIKRRRDLEQARAVARLTVTYLANLPFEPERLRMMPLTLVVAAASMFETAAAALPPN